MPCQTPKSKEPLWMGMLNEVPRSAALTWAGMSSGPSTVWAYGKVSGAMSLSDAYRSRGTLGSAFSLMISDADVC